MNVAPDALLDRLDDRSRGLVELCGRIAAEREAAAYLVGGCVRDLILDAQGKDLDVVVEGDGPALAQALARRIDGRLTRHQAFGTARVDTPDGEHVDVATARSEEYPRPGALPRIEPGTLEDDLERRDFTINTLAITLDPRRPPRLIDPFGGLEDLEAGVVRALHSRSFVDDPTRILRALRFSLRLDYEIEPESERWLQEAIDGGRLKSVSAERLRNEVEALLREFPVQGPVKLQRRGVLGQIHPELDADPGRLEELQRALDWYRDQMGRPGDREEWTLVLAACARDLESEGRCAVVRDLGLSRRDRRPLVDSGRPWRRAVTALEGRSQGEGPAPASRVDRLLRGLDEGALLVGLADLRDGGRERLAGMVEEHLAEHRRVSLHLDGDDLIELGLSEGPAVGEVLERLRAARLDGEVDDEDEERALAAREIRRRTDRG